MANGQSGSGGTPNYWRLLLPGEAANFPYRIQSFGRLLRANKATLLQAFAARNIAPGRRALMMTMAMIETTHLAQGERDAKKDGRTDGSANASIFNLNEDMMRRLGYQGDIHLLDPLSALPQVVALIDKGIEQKNWGLTPGPGGTASGVTALLNYVRGGADAYRDGVSWDAANYRNAVATGLRLISDDPSLMSDDRRVTMNVAYQG